MTSSAALPSAACPATTASLPDRPIANRHRACLIRGASIRFADRLVLDSIDLTIGPTERIAVVGDNGAGKSTLLHLLAGVLTPTAGERVVDLPRGLSLAEQQPEFPPGTSVAQALDLLLADVRTLEAQLVAAAEALAASASGSASDPASKSPVEPDLLAAYARALERFEAREAGLVDRRVDAALDRLCLGGLDRARPVRSLSGGERARLALAAAVSAQAELLLLDEPTNDLDATGLEWLEDRLTEHRGALVVVTHDRAFLDRFTTDICVLEEAGLRRYGNGYSGYLRAQEAERRRIREEYEDWTRDVTRQSDLLAANAGRAEAIPRKMAKAAFGHGAFRARSRSHGATSRIRQAKEHLNRLLDAPARTPTEPLRFATDLGPAWGVAPGREGDSESESPDEIIVAAGIRLGGQDRTGGRAERNPPELTTPTGDDGSAPALTGPNLALEALTIRAGDRWVVSGPNGAGKTTLLKILAGELDPDVGVLEHRPGLRVGWLRQDLSPVSEAPFVALFAQVNGLYEVDAAQRLLDLGLFHARDLDRPVSELSIGQRRRLDLAVAVSAHTEVLLLDEPTNHLSPELVEQLEGALRDYSGAVVTVTHDRRWQENAAAHGRLGRIHVEVGGQVRVDS